MKISVVIPAHNEEHHLPLCLDAIDLASKRTQHDIETIVVLNRCSDQTPEIASSRANLIVHEEAKNLSLIRNAGVAAATGEILITIDADSRLHPNTFDLVAKKLESGKFIGGGAMILPERYSLGIVCSFIALFPYIAYHRVSCGLFWCYKKDFDAIQGFNPEFVSIEDLDFAKRLRSYGKLQKKRFGTLLKTPITTSCRKFDQFGDWYLLINPDFVKRVFKGNDQAAANHFWYDARDKDDDK